MRHAAADCQDLQNTMPDSATVTVVRNDAQDVAQRQLIVWLDGERIATLLFGDEVTRPVATGPHRLRISNTLFWKTVTFDAKPGERIRFEAINRGGRLTSASGRRNCSRRS